MKNENSHGADAFTYAENWTDLLKLDEGDEKFQRMSIAKRPLKSYNINPIYKRWWG